MDPSSGPTLGRGARRTSSQGEGGRCYSGRRETRAAPPTASLSEQVWDFLSLATVAWQCGQRSLRERAAFLGQGPESNQKEKAEALQHSLILMPTRFCRKHTLGATLLAGGSSVPEAPQPRFTVLTVGAPTHWSRLPTAVSPAPVPDPSPPFCAETPIDSGLRNTKSPGSGSQDPAVPSTSAGRPGVERSRSHGCPLVSSCFFYKFRLNVAIIRCRKFSF